MIAVVVLMASDMPTHNSCSLRALNRQDLVGPITAQVALRYKDDQSHVPVVSPPSLTFKTGTQ